MIRSDEAAERDGKAKTTNQWKLWLAYWRQLGVPTKALLSIGIATVPCEWPYQFDAAAPSELSPEPCPQPRRQPHGPKRDIGPMMERLADNMRPPAPVRAVKTPIEHLVEMKAKPAIAPPLSAAARRALGLHDHHEDAAE